MFLPKYTTSIYTTVALSSLNLRTLTTLTNSLSNYFKISITLSRVLSNVIIVMFVRFFFYFNKSRSINLFRFSRSSGFVTWTILPGFCNFNGIVLFTSLPKMSFSEYLLEYPSMSGEKNRLYLPPLIQI